MRHSCGAHCTAHAVAGSIELVRALQLPLVVLNALVCSQQHGGCARPPYAAVIGWAACPSLAHAALAQWLPSPAALDALPGLQQVALP